MSKRNQTEWIANILTVFLAAAVLFAVFMTLCGNRMYVVRSGSMEPAVKTGSLAFVNKNAPYDEIKTGDILCFKAGGELPVLHRAVQIEEDGIRTKGDANRSLDSASVTEENYAGKVSFCIPYVGYGIYYLASVRGRIVLLTALAVLAILKVFRRISKKASKKAVAAVLVFSLVLSGTAGSHTAVYASGEESIPGEETVLDSEAGLETKDEQNSEIQEETQSSQETAEGEDENDEMENDNPAENPDPDPADPNADSADDHSQETDSSDEITPESEQPEESSPEDENTDNPEEEEWTEDEREEEIVPTEDSEPPEDPDEAETVEETVFSEQEEEKEDTGNVRGAAAGVYTATVRYRVNDGSVARNTAAKTQYAVGTDIGINNTLVYKSTDYGANWSLLKTEVTTQDTSADLENVGTIGITLPGYRITQTTAYNTRADQSGTVLCQNADTLNPVTTKRLNGGTEITEDVTIDVYVNWQTTLILDANGGGIWGNPAVTSVSAGTIQYGASYSLINRLSASDSSVDASFLPVVPNFYREGYVFDGWNTYPDGSSSFGTINHPDTQLGRGGKVRIRKLISDGSSESGTIRLYAQWIRREGINGSRTLSNGAVLTNQDHFGRNSITGTNLTIPYTVSSNTAADYSAEIGSSDFAWQMDGSVGRFYYTRAISDPTSSFAVPGTLGVRLNNRAYDNAGRFYDISIILSNIVLNPQRLGTYESYAAGSISLFGYDTRTGLVTAYVDGGKVAGASYDIEIRILQHGTNSEVTGMKTILYFQDLDSEDTSSMHSLYRFVSNQNGLAPYTEAIAVPTETSVEFYTKEGENYILADVKNGATRLTGGEHTGPQSAMYGQITPAGNASYQDIPMSDQEYAAVLFPVETGKMKITWSGSNCGTSLFASPAVGMIQVVKTSSDSTVTEGNDSYSFAGAVFGIYGDEASAAAASEVGAVNGSEFAVLITDDTGYTPVSQELTLGMYYLAELSAPKGYKRNREIQTVWLTEEGQTVLAEVCDSPLLDSIGILLQKTDEKGNRVPEEYAAHLAGAEFLLQYYDKTAESLELLASDSPERSWAYVTNETGAVEFSDESLKISGDPLYYDPVSGLPALPPGTLVITETIPPPGFVRDSRSYLLIIGFDESEKAIRNLYDAQGNLLDRGKVFEMEPADVGLKIMEPIQQIELTIEKQIYREDLLKEHGEVSFAFEVSGADRIGEAHTFHQVISFAEEEEGTGMASEYARILIPAGEYEIRELETDRYSLTEIVANTDNLTVSMENKGDLIGNIQPVTGYAGGVLIKDASVRFVNRKTDWGGFTHTSSVENYIGEVHYQV